MALQVDTDDGQIAAFRVDVTVQIPRANDEPTEHAAVVTWVRAHHEGDRPDVYIGAEALEGELTEMPTEHPVYLRDYVVFMPTPEHAELLPFDDEARTALREYGWKVL